MTSSHLPVSIKFYFGLGQAADYIKNFGFGTLLMLYYNQVLGLSGAYAGAAVSISIAFDAISDPMVGSWSDGYRSRWGRRLPFMVGAAVPLGVTFYCLFMPPVGLNEFGLFLWLTSFAVLSRTALTFFNVPYYALGAEMTQDYHERTQLVVIRTAFGIASNFLVIAIAWNFIFVQTPGNATPQLTRAPYFPYALLSAVTMTLLMLACCRGTLRVASGLSGDPGPSRTFSFLQVYRDLYQSLHNHSFRSLFIGTLLFFIYAGTHGALAMHLMTFYWQLDAKGIEYVQYGTIAGGILALPLVPMLNHHLEKKGTLYLGVIVGALAGTGPVMLKLVHAMPTSPDTLVPVLVVLGVLGSMGGVAAGVTGASMMGDIADEHELESGSRREGVFFGCFNFASKCSGAAGTLIAGLALDIIGFPVNSKPGMVPEPVLFHFGLVYGVVAIMMVLAIWVFLPYRLNKARHDEIVGELQRLRQDSLPGPEAVFLAEPGTI